MSIFGGDAVARPARRGDESMWTREIGGLGAIAGKVLWGVASLLAGALLLFTVPMTWGWYPGIVGSGVGGWSMASERGIMPLSLTYHRRQDSYGVGDFVVFDYQGSNDPEQNGRSVKAVVGLNEDGSYRVAGLNPHNSVPPWDAPPDSIYGKIVAHRSIAPRSFWRWLSMEWGLEAAQISARFRTIVSADTIVNTMSQKGRWHNRMKLDLPPCSIQSRNPVESRASLAQALFTRKHRVVVVQLESGLVVWGSNHHEIPGFYYEGWHGDELKISRRVDSWRKEYALYNPTSGMFLANREENGAPRLSEGVAKHYSWGSVYGPLVWAMDGNPHTSWIASSATGRFSESRVEFHRSGCSGTIELTGGGDAATSVEIFADGTSIGGAVGLWEQLTLQFKATEIIIRFDRGEPSSHSGVSTARIHLVSE